MYMDEEGLRTAQFIGCLLWVFLAFLIGGIAWVVFT